MTVPAIHERVVTVTQQRPVSAPLTDIFQSLLHQLDREQAPMARVVQRTAEQVEEIIFEANLEGMHYYVIRTQPSAQQSVVLSPREQTIARLVVKGLPNKVIGEMLDISPWTVATHLRRIFSKLEVTTRTAMVARLLEESLL